MAGRPDRPDADRIEARMEEMAGAIATLSARIASLAARIEALEDARGRRPEAASGEARAAPLDDQTTEALFPVAGLDLVGLLTPLGRTCLVLGGAYLLRALTEAGRIPVAGGIALGLAYALVWFLAADSTAVRRPLSGLFHGFTAVIIGLPILWEASQRFEVLRPDGSAAALALFLLAAFAVARHRRLQSLAAVASLGVIGTALGLAITSGVLWPYALLLIGTTIAASWLGDACRWPWLCWPPALAAVVAVAPLAPRAALQPPPDPPAAALFTALLLCATPLGLAAARVARGGVVRLFDAAWALLALGAGLGAAMAIAARTGTGAPAMIAAGALLTGILAYGAAFLLLRVRPSEERNIYYFAVLGLLLLLVAIAGLAAGVARDLSFTLLAVACAWLGARAVHPVFAAHSAVYALAAAFTSGLVACSLAIWFATPKAWPAFPPTGWIVLVAALPGGLIARRAASRALEIAASLSRLVLACVLVATLGSLIVLLVGPLLAGTPPDPGRLASLKTIVLASAAVGLALVARLPFGGELGWLATPALIAGGLKFVLEDFRVSNASMLFVALAVYGTALILTARIRTARRVPEAT
jgi:hypothetical protein